MNYSKKIVMMAAMSGLVVACVPKFPLDREAILRQAEQLNDSINRLMMTGDSAKIVDAMFLQEQLVQLDTIREHQFRYYMQRVTKLYELGRDTEAFTLQEKAMELLPEDNFDRLNYFGIKNEKLGLQDKANYFFTMAFECCNEAFEHGGDVDALINKATILYYQGRKDDAHKVIEEAYLKHQNSKTLKSLATDPNLWKEIEASVNKMKSIKIEQPDSIQ